MSDKYKIILLIILLVGGLLVTYGYTYFIAEYQIRNALAQTSAPTNYTGVDISAIPQNLTLIYNGESIILSPATISSWYEKYSRIYTQTEQKRLNSKAITEYLKNIADSINTEAIDANFDYKDGEIIEFVAPHAGKQLDIDKSYAKINEALTLNQDSAELIFKNTEPQITLDKINQLGITSLLAKGESDFKGSPTARMHNIKIAAKIFDSILVKPGEELSFNKILGDVDALNGYQPELVIKSGGVVKEYGGGICQVSTTLFRAAINAGLPIIERKPHTLPVRYYNPQGFDATIYPGVTDLRFTNDTGNNILIQPQITGTKIAFNIYGTKDNRIVQVTTPHQYASNPDGSTKYVFTRTIDLPSEETKKETFYSSYKPPLASPVVRNPLE